MIIMAGGLWINKSGGIAVRATSEMHAHMKNVFIWGKVEKSLRILAVFAMAMVIGGCVWFRLLEIKNQLADFDDNVTVSVVDQHFILNFRKPTLLSEDFVYLSKLRPSRVEHLDGGGYRWYLDFRIDPIREPEQKKKQVSFVMTYNAKDRLVSFDFSPLFVQMAPVAFLEASIRSLGIGKIDQDKRQLKVDPEDLPKIVSGLPRSTDITRVMGSPEIVESEAGLKVLVYHFKAESFPVDPEYEDRRIAEARLYFDPKKDEMLGLKGRFAGLKLTIDYRRFTQNP